MRTIGVYLIFAAVVLRTAVVLLEEPAFPIMIALLAAYGILLFGEARLMRQKYLRYLQSPKTKVTYLIVQSALVIGGLVISTYEDFLAALFIPLSLDAVSFFGRRIGYISIAIFSLTMLTTFLFSDQGPLFGLAMGILYSGICFMFGGYAYQVQKAQAARIQNDQTFSELQAAHRQLQGYADQIANLAMEHERSRLARDLHDSVTQTVFSMNLAAESARLLLNKEPPHAVLQLKRIEELAASAQREIQSLVSQLRPRSIMEEGLPATLRQLAAEQKSLNGLQVWLEVRGESALSETVATSLYSIAHEALINVSKHSQVCEVIVRLRLEKENSCLEIEDHGLGFDRGAKNNERGHLGLASMFERAREIGWKLSVQSRPGQGTQIRVTENLFEGTA